MKLVLVGKELDIDLSQQHVIFFKDLVVIENVFSKDSLPQLSFPISWIEDIIL